MNDKVAHAIAGYAIALTVALYAPPVYGMAAAVLIGLAKEYLDSRGFGTPDKYDFIFTAGGGIIGTLVATIGGLNG